MNNVIAFLKKKDLYLGIARYLLGAGMITYGITKILKTQCVVIPFSTWQLPFEEATGKSLTWAFLSYSPWFEVLLGYCELIPAILLLFRRTTLLGAILMFPMVLNVFLINHALDLWAGTKTIALEFLILNLTVLVFEWKRLWALALIVIGNGIKLKYNLVEVLINLLVIGGASFLILPQLFAYMNQTNFLTGDWLDQRPNEWNLKSETIGDSVARQRKLRIYFGSYGSYTEISDTGHVKRGDISYTLDEKKHQISFTSNASQPAKPSVDTYNYTLQGDSLLKMEKIIDSAKNTRLVRVFKQRVMLRGKKEK